MFCSFAGLVKEGLDTEPEPHHYMAATQCIPINLGPDSFNSLEEDTSLDSFSDLFLEDENEEANPRNWL